LQQGCDGAIRATPKGSAPARKMAESNLCHIGAACAVLGTED
jgi:hypothetical protein